MHLISVKISKIIMRIVMLISLTLSTLCHANSPEYFQYEPFTLSFTGPDTSELAEINPFMDYRLDVTFTLNGQKMVVPGYFAADGNAAETSADKGNQWQVKFAAEKAGKWQYQVSFKQGKDVAIAPSTKNAQPIKGVDGFTGSVNVQPKRSGPYAKGRLEYVGEHYLKFSGNGQTFLKLGVDSPENFLAIDDIDATPNVGKRRKSWSPHKNDYNQDADAFLWQNYKGKNTFAAINYLAQQGLNSFSFLTFNVDGDDRNVFPQLLKVTPEKYQTYANKGSNTQAWHAMFHKTRFDVSKLAQWERVFSYGSQKGFFLHFKNHEMETDHVMDHGKFGDEYKVYYRELIARFAHHPAINWNLGEEQDTNTQHRRAIAAYIKQLTPYKKQHIVMHTKPTDDHAYAELVGNQSELTGASLQLMRPDFRDVYPRIIKWRNASAKTGKPWALAVDEAGHGAWALLTDAETPTYDEARVRVLWATLLAGGWGVEWYFGYQSPNNDLNAQDYRSRANFWQYNRHAIHFFKQHMALGEFSPLHQSDDVNALYVAGVPDEQYLVFLINPVMLNQVQLDTPNISYKISWYNTRKGGDLQAGSKLLVTSTTGKVDLGLPPTEIGTDWLVILTAIDHTNPY
ncbi:DUF5060 domain-containing protein [Paraglaciecola aquimarina]|uniref:DUF5060 domain-containing protein n=1 Tax=Paraglaciecola algarum TaxID=3050085 RepID=A0ABS9D244_9ALTE|nr:DUF5060 domain-containing protein [Paraglaciecola sp. G1-23]MCF2946941.1 DUF5060 domain-containing protein [Paraglaciecola sp. G1-23]